jgi:putative ABC transport system substrate-binding protein
MRRRSIVLGGLAAPISRLALGQSAAELPNVGVLFPTPPSGGEYERAIREGLQEQGLVDGRNMRLLVRFSATGVQGVTDLAHELAAAGCRLIITTGTTAVTAAHAAVPRMPIVMAGSADPVAMGLAQSLARPGGVITGVSILGEDFLGKEIELLRELLPSAATFVAILHGANPGNPTLRRALEMAGHAQGAAMEIREVSATGDFVEIFSSAARQNAGGVFLIGDPLFTQNREAIFALAAANRLPVVATDALYVRAGAIAAYSVDYVAMARASARYVARIIGGADPAELPIEQPTRLKLLVNIKAATATGVSIPASLAARADEVIE